MQNSSASRILFSSQSFYPSTGGVSTLLLALSRYLIAKGFAIDALHLPMVGVAKPKAVPHGIVEHVVRCEPISPNSYKKHGIFKEILYRHLHGLIPFRYRSMSTVPGFESYMELSKVYSQFLGRLVAERPVSLVHFHDYQVIPSIAAVPSGISSLFSLHAPLLPSISPVFGAWLLEYWSHSSTVIFSTPQYADVARSIGLPDQKIAVIPPIIDVDALERAQEDTIGSRIQEGTVVVTCIQRFDSKSGHVQLIRAFHEVRQALKGTIRTVLVLIGGKSYTDTISTARHSYVEEAKSLSKALALDDDVLFLGNVDYYALGEVYNRSDIVVMLSKMECFGLSVSEAMCKAKPVVVTDVGGLAYQVIDGITGFVVPRGDVSRTSEALLELCRSPDLRKAMGTAGRKRFANLLEPSKLISRYVEIYDSSLTGCGRPAITNIARTST